MLTEPFLIRCFQAGWEVAAQTVFQFANEGFHRRDPTDPELERYHPTLFAFPESPETCVWGVLQPPPQFADEEAKALRVESCPQAPRWWLQPKVYTGEELRRGTAS